MMIGYRFLGLVYLGFFLFLFHLRYMNSYRQWVALNPFDIIDDIISMLHAVRNWTIEKSVSTKEFVRLKVEAYVVRPIRAVYRKVYSMYRWLVRMVKMAVSMFIDKVATPLYISISHKVVALWQVLKSAWSAFAGSLKKLAWLVAKIFSNIYGALFQIVKSVSKFYANALEHSLRVALSFGNLGELLFTIVVIFCMVSPSLLCYLYYAERWFIILSTLLTLVLMVTGYKHLSRVKERVLSDS